MTIFDKIDHECTSPQEQFPPRESNGNFKYQLKRLWFSLVQVSPVHAMTNRFFSTESQLREERKRHYESTYFTIHPLSKLAVLREAYLSLFYTVTIFFRLMDFAFYRRTKMDGRDYDSYLSIVNVIDVLSWLNLACMCFEGVIVKKTKSIIVIDFIEILRYRVRSFLFWCEMLSSMPKFFICHRKSACVRPFWLFLTCLRLFAVCLFYQPVRLLKPTLAFFRIESRTIRIYVSVIYLMAFVTHLMACSEFAMARYRYLLVGFRDNKSWIIKNNLINKELRTQYFYTFYIATAQTFGVHIDEFDDNANWEESVVSVLNYMIGKMMLLIMWVVNLNVLLAQDFYNAKYQELISQLKTWMDKKELPKDLRKRLINYLNFYYRKYVFNKREIENTMPYEVFTKVRANMYKTIRLSKGGVLTQISDHDLQIIGEHTATEYYSPKDVVIHSGTKLHSIYLLASGSVAVYSQSGTEAYHLYDGSYFGELNIMLPDQNVSGSVIAIEACKVYRIEKKYFERYIISKKEIYDNFLEDALSRFAKIKMIEEKHRQSMMIERKAKQKN